MYILLSATHELRVFNMATAKENQSQSQNSQNQQVYLKARAQGENIRIVKIFTLILNDLNFFQSHLHINMQIELWF